MSDEIMKKLDEIGQNVKSTLVTKLPGQHLVNDETIRNITKYVIECYDFSPADYDIQVKQSEDDPYQIEVTVIERRPMKFITLNMDISKV